MVIEHKLKFIPLRIAFEFFSFLKISDKLLCNPRIEIFFRSFKETTRNLSVLLLWLGLSPRSLPTTTSLFP